MPTASAGWSARATCLQPATLVWSSARAAAKAALGDRVFVLGHHYQRDEVIAVRRRHAATRFKLAQQAAARPEAEFIVFCGVHFMAECADILPPARSRP